LPCWYVRRTEKEQRQLDERKKKILIKETKKKKTKKKISAQENGKFEPKNNIAITGRKKMISLT